MNLYFLSLLKSDFKKEKKIGLTYKVYEKDNPPNSIFESVDEIGEKDKKVLSSYLRTRFPFLQRGDIICGLKLKDDFWTANDICWDYGVTEDYSSDAVNPFFYQMCCLSYHITGSWVTTDLKERISKSEIVIHSFVEIKRFKIGNRRYTIRFSSNRESKEELIGLIRDPSSLYFQEINPPCRYEKKLVVVLQLLGSI
jgi:hypothetical protein